MDFDDFGIDAQKHRRAASPHKKSMALRGYLSNIMQSIAHRSLSMPAGAADDADQRLRKVAVARYGGRRDKTISAQTRHQSPSASGTIVYPRLAIKRYCHISPFNGYTDLHASPSRLPFVSNGGQLNDVAATGTFEL